MDRHINSYANEVKGFVDSNLTRRALSSYCTSVYLQTSCVHVEINQLCLKLRAMGQIDLKGGFT